MDALAERVDAAHQRLLRDGDVLPDRLPDDRALSSEELDELTWRVYCLSRVTRQSLVRCNPALVVAAAHWWGDADPRWWERFCEVTWP
jgi:hypothetical protein